MTGMVATTKAVQKGPLAQTKAGPVPCLAGTVGVTA